MAKSFAVDYFQGAIKYRSCQRGTGSGVRKGRLFPLTHLKLKIPQRVLKNTESMSLSTVEKPLHLLFNGHMPLNSANDVFVAPGAFVDKNLTYRIGFEAKLPSLPFPYLLQKGFVIFGFPTAFNWPPHLFAKMSEVWSFRANNVKPGTAAPVGSTIDSPENSPLCKILPRLTCR